MLDLTTLSKLKTAFNANGDPTPLEGGQGTSFLIGDIVLKPIDNPDYFTATAKIWNTLTPGGYKTVKHLLSADGYFVEHGYCASRFLPMTEDDNALRQKLDVSKTLHADLLKLGIDKLPHSPDPWTKANRVLWLGDKPPVLSDSEKASLFTFLQGALHPITDSLQLIHSDLGGNILFDENNVPVVIDFSPAIAPKRYADSIIVSDSIAWAGLPIDSLQLLTPFDEYREYVKYAVAFRVLTLLFCDDKTAEQAETEWQQYKPIWDYAVGG